MRPVDPKEHPSRQHLGSEQQTGQRAGQRAYNDLADREPEIAALITGTDADPFYDDGRLEAFHRRVTELRNRGATPRGC